MLLFKIFSMGLSLRKKAGTQRSRRLARHTVTSKNKKNKPARDNSVALSVSPPTAYTPSNQNRELY